MTFVSNRTDVFFHCDGICHISVEQAWLGVCLNELIVFSFQLLTEHGIYTLFEKLETDHLIRSCWLEKSNALDTVSSDYGIDPEGPIAKEDTGTVVVPETLSPISDDNLQDFLSTIDTHSSLDDLGVQHYMDCKQYILSM